MMQRASGDLQSLSTTRNGPRILSHSPCSRLQERYPAVTNADCSGLHGSLSGPCQSRASEMQLGLDRPILSSELGSASIPGIGVDPTFLISSSLFNR